MSRGPGALVTLVGALAISACAGGGDDATPANDSPLAELMGWVPEAPVDARRKELQVEQLIAECMRKEGFEYDPIDYRSPYPEGYDEDTAMAVRDPEAFGQKYGYGVVHFYEMFDVPAVRSGEGPPGIEIADPNEDYLQSLSATEQEDYAATLDGDAEIWEQQEGETISSDVFISPPLDAQGCRGRARLAVFGRNPADANPDIQRRVNDYRTTMSADPRLTAVNAKWAECMRDDLAGLTLAGEPIDAPDDMQRYVEELKLRAQGLHPQSDNDAQSGEFYTVDASGVAWLGTAELIPEDELEALRSHEFAMWRRDTKCQDDVDLPAIRREVEQQFVDELTADFPELAGEHDSDGGS